MTPATIPGSSAPVERAGRAEPAGSHGATDGLVLLYHRVADLPTDPQLLAVSPAHFRQQLDALTSECRVMALSAMIERVQAGTLPPRSVAITFDDGYADNLTQAAPLLRECGAPATVFVASGYVGGPREFWWDELEALLLRPGSLPRVLSVEFGNAARTWDLGEVALYTEGDFTRHRAWTVTQRVDPTPRQRAYRELFDYLRTMRPGHRNDALAVLDEASRCDTHHLHAGVHAPDSDAQRHLPKVTHQPLTRAQLRELAADGLIEIGAHTVNHPVLSALPVPEQLAEITPCKADLEAIIDRPVTSFSYPFGTRRDYTSETVQLVRQAGFHQACSNFAGLVTGASDPFQLPRVLVRDWDADTLMARVAEVSRVP